MRILFLVVVAFGLNPITRVAELLEGLAKKVEMDGKAEQDLYDKYKCWCDKVMESKSASIEVNNARISELTQYIDDLTNGRVELTTERSDLEAEIAGLEKSIAEATAMRKTEKSNFRAAKDEMTKAIRALDKALTTLQTATSPYTNGGVFSSIAHQLKSVNVLTTGSGFLARRDVEDLQKFLEVPEEEWKMLNKDATFKMQYAARSTQIQDVLQDMYNTFVDNRDDAIDSESKAQSDYDTLVGAKRTSLQTAKQALLDKSAETGARQLALAESNKEKDDLEDQNTNDQGFFRTTRQSCNTKSAEWDERKRLRTAEVASISEAIGVLRSDDARDTFGKSFESQSFVQLKHNHEHLRDMALSTLRKVAAKTKDIRLSALTTEIAMMKQAPAADVTDDPFREIFTAIDNMVTALRTEESTDLRNKEYCEEARMNKTQESKMLSKEIDTNTETIERLNAQVAAANKTIEEITQQVRDLISDKRDAHDQRDKENREYLIDKKDDQDAAALVETAVGVLKKFYTDNNLGLIQKTAKVRAHQEPGQGGEAPPPPPSTWEADYGGAEGEHNGIVAILELIKQDIEKDMEKADLDERESNRAYNALIRDIDSTIGALRRRRGGLEGDVSTDMGLVVQEKGFRTGNQGSLTSKLNFLKQIAPGCDFIATHFETRLKNRQMELDGLAKAKAILASAVLE